MRILWVKAGKLLPVDSGGKIRTYHILRHLSRRQPTTFLSYYGGRPDPAYEENLKQQFPDAIALPTSPKGVGRTVQALDYATRLPRSAPYAVAKFTSREVRGWIHQAMVEQRFDIMVCDFLSASLNFPTALTTPTVLFQHNVESALWDRQARFERNPATRLLFRLEAWKMRRYEPKAVSRFHHVVAVSDHDRDLLSRMTDPGRISVTPTGVDVSSFEATATREPADVPTLLFLGSMDWEANIDAVEFFCSEMWPQILAAVPTARFRVVGRNPHPRILRLASESIEVTGTVPSVIEHLADASVVVVPLRIGGGTRLKIYEAMAAGRAIVSTSVGAEGLSVRDGQDIRLADTPEEFTRIVITLLRDVNTRRELADAARAAAAQFDWSMVAGQFERTLAEVLDRHEQGTEHRPPVAFGT